MSASVTRRAPPSEMFTLASEDLFLAELRSGDPRAYERLVREHGGAMLAVARRILGGDRAEAEDALQLAFVGAFRAISRFNGDCSLSTWLHRITVNAALMRLRSRARRPELSIDELLPAFIEDGHHAAMVAPLDVEAMLVDAEERQRLRAAVDRLPADYREVLILRDIEELDTAETAQLLGMNIGAVKTRLHRARQALLTLLAPPRETVSA